MLGNFRVLIEKATDYAKHIADSTLSREDALWSFLLYFIPRIGFPLPVLALTGQDCNKIIDKV
jgi:hypothetical protein